MDRVRANHWPDIPNMQRQASAAALSFEKHALTTGTNLSQHHSQLLYIQCVGKRCPWDGCAVGYKRLMTQMRAMMARQRTCKLFIA